MEALEQRLAGIDDALSAFVREVLSRGVVRCGAVTTVSDDDLLSFTAGVARLGRLADALLVEAVGEVRARCRAADRAERMSTVRGCRDTNELLRRATRSSARRVAELQRGAVGVRQPVSPTSGQALPAAYPALRDALCAGDVSAEALAGVFRELDDAGSAASAAQRLAADTELAAAASGTAPDGQPAAGCDELRLQAQVWAMALDPDGAEPRDDLAQRRRGVRLGGGRDGLVSLHGDLLPDVAAQLQKLFDAIENPKARRPAFTPDGGDPVAGGVGGEAGDAGTGDHVTVGVDGDVPLLEADRRTVPQLHHDALAAILIAAAGSADTPTLGGAPPTLTVAVTAADLATGRGYCHIDGCDGLLPVAVARHTACTGRIECTTFDTYGRILAIHVHDRIFTAHQRRAIALRDGGCVIPDCHVRAAWCEVHHVTEWNQGGPTSTDNGVMLCWFHHRTLETSGWHVRIRRGIPEIRGPAWWDTHRHWRRAGKHPVWMRPRRDADTSPSPPLPSPPPRERRTPVVVT